MNHKRNNRHNCHRLSTRLAMIVALSATLALGACGGGNIDTPEGKVDQTIPASEAMGASAGLTLQATDAKPSAQTIAALKEGARLNAAELETIAKTGVLPAPFEGKLLSGAGENQSEPAFTPNDGTTEKSGAMPKSSASRIAVYRFYNTRTGSHFFTTSVPERDTLQAYSPHMRYEGPAFYASGSLIPGLSPVHRFYNARTGVHFYTISEAERAHVVGNLPQFTYEGIAYYASTTAGTGYTPLYRFLATTRGFHFYTSSLTERNRIIGGLVPGYSYEGIGYYVLGEDWRPEKLPHTGINTNQCLQAGSDDLVNCGSLGAVTLNLHQDGHRAALNPMSFSAVGAYPITSCVRDNVTGLIWEGKTASGARAGTNTYNNHLDGRSGSASAYVSAVNAITLCGFSDWRLPARNELLNIVDFGQATAPKVKPAWFPNSAASRHWSSEVVSTSTEYWYVDFLDGRSSASMRSDVYAVRLVRGATPSGPRYTYSTVAYGSDGANNLVNDAWTGLQWRRCEEGKVWTGTACTGALYFMTFEQAMTYTRASSGWRLPNVKELSSLVDLRVRSGAPIDPVAFPDAGMPYYLTSTPFVGVRDNHFFWWVGFISGDVSSLYGSSDSNVGPIRLVRARR